MQVTKAHKARSHSVGYPGKPAHLVKLIPLIRFVQICVCLMGMKCLIRWWLLFNDTLNTFLLVAILVLDTSPHGNALVCHWKELISDWLCITGALMPLGYIELHWYIFRINSFVVFYLRDNCYKDLQPIFVNIYIFKYVFWITVLYLIAFI